MKLRISFLIAFIFISSFAFGQVVLDGNWHYSFTDSKEYSSASFNHSEWKTKPADKLRWSKPELPGDSKILWVRKTIIIPSSLKQEFSKTGVLAVTFGRIQQEDTAYLNGKQIGTTNSGDLERVYILNEGDILWDKENTFALRIRHWGDVSSVGKLPAIAAAMPKNLFVSSTATQGSTAKDQVKNKDITYSYMVFNKSPRTLSAKLTTDFYDVNEHKINTVQKDVFIKPGENAFKFPYKTSNNFIKVQYHLNIPQYDYTNTYNAELGYIDVAYKPGLPVVANKAVEVFKPADLNKQKINGWLGERMKANQYERLYKVDEPALLAGYINKPGIHPWIGEHVGKFLEAACNTYQNTHDPELKIQIDRTAQQLIASQLNDGYLGTYDASSHWTSWDVWSHKYNLIGLLSYYSLSGYKPALAAAEKIGDLLCNTFGDKPGQADIIKAGTHEGMAATSVLDPMTDLYRFSGNKKHLDFCYYITKSFNNKNGPRIISTLDSIGRVDKTANAKAYEMLSNLVGLVKLYRVTADKQFLTPVLRAWKDITDNRLYITGTTSSFEHFQDNHLLPASAKDNMGEGCVTTTWIQFNYNLLCLFGKMEYLDEIERSVYNHLTGAENPQTGCVSYYTPLMGVKPYGCNITCCMSSVPRGIAMIPLFANGQISQSPSFLFYQPGSYSTVVGNTAKTNVSFTTETAFPQNGDVVITVDPAMAAKFSVLLRRPYWASDFKVKVNGASQAITGQETLLLNRVWKKGDRISVQFEMPVKILDGGISYPGAIALQRGPQVLVLDSKLNKAPANEVSIPANVKLQNAANALPQNWIGTQAYQLKAQVNGTDENVVVVPYADASQTNGNVTTWIKKIK